MADLRTTLRSLYTGPDRRASTFQYGLLSFDLIVILFFVVSTAFGAATWILILDLVIAAILAVDFAARTWIAPRRMRFLTEPETLADIIVILSLLASAVIENLAFLRVLRALRVLRSYHVLRDLRRRSTFFKANEQIIQASLNLAVFLFIVTALVYVSQVRTNPGIETYIDALYFTVTTLTTTGFGDITLLGTSGRLLAVIIMVLGVALFIRLAQTIFRPSKVAYECPDCGLNRHDPDAVHCKHCGRLLHIQTEGG